MAPKYIIWCTKAIGDALFIIRKVIFSLGIQWFQISTMSAKKGGFEVISQPWWGLRHALVSCPKHKQKYINLTKTHKTLSQMI